MNIDYFSESFYSIALKLHHFRTPGKKILLTTDLRSGEVDSQVLDGEDEEAEGGRSGRHSPAGHGLRGLQQARGHNYDCRKTLF